MNNGIHPGYNLQMNNRINQPSQNNNNNNPGFNYSQNNRTLPNYNQQMINRTLNYIPQMIILTNQFRNPQINNGANQPSQNNNYNNSGSNYLQVISIIPSFIKNKTPVEEYINLHNINSRYLKNQIDRFKKFCQDYKINNLEINKDIKTLSDYINSTKELIIDEKYKNYVNHFNNLINKVNKINRENNGKIARLSSEIINIYNINTFEELVCKTENLKPLYRMTRDGANTKAMQEKIKNHSHIVVLVKTNKGKIFGGYTSREIKYDGYKIRDDKAFLFSIDLNKKFNIKGDRCAILDIDLNGIDFGCHDLVLLGVWNKCYSFFGDEASRYENNGITRDEFCGGKEEIIDPWLEIKCPQFSPIEIEVFEIIPSGKEYSSKIITNEKDYETFENILTDTNNMKLAYRMSEDGKNNNKMIKNIDKSYNNIILIKTKQGNTFGCYIPKDEGRPKEEDEKKDERSFIFSIDKYEIFNYNLGSKGEIKINSEEIKIGKDLNINLNKENQSYLSLGNTYRSNNKKTKNIISGKEEKNKIYFEIEEIEIFNTNEIAKQLFPYSSEIINEDNKNIFENLVCQTNKLKLLYRKTKDGVNLKSTCQNKKLMQNKVRGHSNIVVLVKTDENKIFGGYTSCKIEYYGKAKKDNKSFLYSIDLNEKFNIKENEDAICVGSIYGIRFGYGDLILFDEYNKCYSQFGNEYSHYKNNEITRDEFCGSCGKTKTGREPISKFFTPIEIEIFEMTEEE